MDRQDLTDEYREETGKCTMVSDDVVEPHYTMECVNWLEAKVLNHANGDNTEQDNYSLPVVTPSIYKMKLHERMNINGLRITRVAGGWIYDEINNTQIFIPYDNEFMLR